MKFSVSKKELLNALNLSVRAISANTPLPALSGIKFIVGLDELTLISSDSNISIKTVINANDDTNTLSISEDGDVIIDAKNLLDMVRRIDNDKIYFETIDGTLIKIYGDKSEYKINGMRAFEYPDINFESNVDSFELNTKLLGDIISETAFACSDKETTKPVLTGVNLRANGNILYINATDSYRLASKTVDLNEELYFNITIPVKYLNEVYHSLNEEEKVNVYIDNQKILFKFKDSLIQTRLLDDAFPETSRLIPNDFSQVLTVDSNKLLKAISNSSFIKSDGKNVIKLTIDNEKVDIDSLNQAVSYHDEVEVINYTGNPIEISCSGKYLEDALKAFNTNEIKLCFSGELKPIIIKDDNNKDLIQLVSPVRNYN